MSFVVTIRHSLAAWSMDNGRRKGGTCWWKADPAPFLRRGSDMLMMDEVEFWGERFVYKALLVNSGYQGHMLQLPFPLHAQR